MNHRQHDQAINALTIVSSINIYERYKVHFNLGVTFAHDQEYDKSVESFEKAYAFTTEQEVVCRITHNMVLILEQAGDSKVDRQLYADAMAYYLRALSQIDMHQACFDSDEIKNRVDKKMQSARKAAAEKLNNNDTRPENTSNASNTDAQLKALEKAAQESSKSRRESMYESTEFQTPDANVKPW